ncbi:phospholipase A2-like [Cloeon dipterum]|uniref:phospholipase A2-like n=1 Tax=Cloeon dipterum TaxID=197152 RepID=UPI0032200EFE
MQKQRFHFKFCSLQFILLCRLFILSVLAAFCVGGVQAFESSEGRSLFWFNSRVAANTNLIYPGTNFCGVGSASRGEELGRLIQLDQCCRMHDQCPDSMPAKTSKHGLENKDFYTRSHCDCDSNFYQCLKAAKGLHAVNVGNIYFNVLQSKCYKQFTRQQCVQIASNGECLRFEAIDEWNWAENPRF